MAVPEAIAIQQGLIPASGFGRHVNTFTQKGKANVAAIPFVIGFLCYEWSYFSKKRKEVRDRQNLYNARMVKIREECKAWKEAGKVMPKKLLVENERKLSPDHNSIYV